MAFPTVEATNESSVNTAGTSHQVSLPTGITAGDLILILADKGSTSASFNALAGWTEVVDEALANGITIWARRADGSEGSTVTFTSTANTRSAHISYRISGAEDPAIQMPELSTVATGTSTGPDPDTCTPTGGAKDYLWIAMFGTAGEEADDDTWVNSAPTNYGTLLQKACGTAGTNLGGMIGAAHRTNNGSSESPDAFNKDASSAWRAYTIAVHPAAPTQYTIFTRPVADATATTSHTVLLPNGSNVSGRLVVIGFSSDGGTVSWPSGWTELTDQTSTGVTLSTAYRFIDGTEGFDGTDDSITVTTSVSTGSCRHPYLVSSGHHASTAPEAASAAPGTPDPPSLDPGGWATELTLWLAFSSSRFAGTYTAAPANYVGLLSSDTGSDIATLGSARRELSAAAEDPGVFTENGGNNSFVTATVAVRPAAAGDATASPAVISAGASLPQPAVTVAAAPTVASTVSTLPQPAVAVAAAPTATQTVVALPQATPDTGGGGATAAPAVIPTPVALPQSAVAASAAPAVATTSATVGDVDVSAGVAPAVTAAVATLPQATPDTGGGNALAQPAVTATTVTAPQAAVSIAVAPAPTATVVTLPSAGVGITEPASTITATTATPLAIPQIGAGPTAIAATTSVGDPDVSIGTAPGTISVVTTLPLVEFVGDVAADINPVTVTVRDRGHTATIEDTGHTVTVLDRGHTATARERH